MTIDKRNNEYFVFILWRHNQKFLLPLFPKPIDVVFCWFYKPARRQEVKKEIEVRGQEARGQEARGREARGREARGQQAREQQARWQEAWGQQARRQLNDYHCYLLCLYFVFYLDFCKLCNFWDNK